MRNGEKKLVYVGNWNNSRFGEQLLELCQGVENIFLIDAIYDSLVIDRLRKNCTSYVHGHSVGGTNSALVEILPHGKQIFSL